jgi:hypothetical protein
MGDGILTSALSFDFLSCSFSSFVFGTMTSIPSPVPEAPEAPEAPGATATTPVIEPGVLVRFLWEDAPAVEPRAFELYLSRCWGAIVDGCERGAREG